MIFTNLIQTNLKTSFIGRHIEYFTFIWKDQITQEIRDKYCKTDVTMRKYGRNMKERPMTDGEISLFLNYIECLRKVK